MKNNNYKILLLSDLKDQAENMLKNTVHIAKMISADIEMLHVKKPTEVVTKENQLSAKRTINSEFVLTSNKIKEVSKAFTKDSGIKINSRFAIGNIKNEIESQINFLKPDLIVLGKRKAKKLSLLGDQITDFVIKRFNIPVFIITEEQLLENNKSIHVGFVNSLHNSLNLNFAEDLLRHTEKPFRSFKIVKKPEHKMSSAIETQETIEYVFEQNDSSVKKIANYLNKSKVNLVCLNRTASENSESTMSSKEIDHLIKSANIPMLLCS